MKVLLLLIVCSLALIACEEKEMKQGVPLVKVEAVAVDPVLEAINTKLKWQGKAIPPSWLAPFSGSLADRYAYTRSLDLNAVDRSNAFIEGEITFDQRGFVNETHPDGFGFTSYRYLGQCGDTMVIDFFENFGGSGVFRSLLFIQSAKDESYLESGEKRTAYLLESVGRQSLGGERKHHEVKLEGDEVVINWDSDKPTTRIKLN